MKPSRRQLGRRTLTGAAALLAGLTTLAVGPWAEPAAAASPVRILNSGGQNGSSAQWLETQSLQEGGSRQLVVTFLGEAAAGRRITGVKLDTNWDGTDNTASIGTIGVSPQYLPNGSNNAMETSRVTLSVNVSPPGVSNGDGHRDVPIFARIVDDQNNQSQTVSGTVHVVDNTNDGTCIFGGCLPDGNQDYPKLNAASGQVSTETTPGTSIGYSFTCDDVDTNVLSDDDECDRANIRWRRLDDGTTGGAQDINTGDNSNTNFSMSFPSQGYYVVEAQFRNENGNIADGGGVTQGWWRIGSAVVNSSTLPTGSISFSGSGVFASTPPSVNAGGVANAVASASDADGAVQVIDWDATNNGSFERREYTVPKGPGSNSGATGDITHPALSTAELTQSVDTSTPGTKTVAARVIDNGGLDGADNIRRTSNTFTGQIRVNAIPVANAQTVNVTEDSTGNAITLTSSDADNQPLPSSGRVYTITQDPPASAGTLNCTTIPNCTFTPAPDFAGSTSFKFKVADGPVTSGTNAGQAWSDSAEATVTIDVAPENDAPVVAAQTVSTDEDTPLAFPVSATDIDGGQVLTFSAQTQPANGSVACSGTDGSAPYAGICNFTPAANFNGQTTFILQATDNGLPSLTGTATITIDVSPVNDAPVAVDQSFNIAEDAGTQSFALAASDIDLDSLSFSVIAPAAAGGSVNCAGAACTFTPDADFNGTSVITFQVTDSGSPQLSDTGTVTFNVAPVNDPPQAVAQEVTTDEDTPLDITLGATDIDTPPAGLTFTAPTGANGPDHGSVAPVAGPVVNYSPDANYNGGDQFDFTVDDGEYQSSNTVVVAVTPVNDVPTVPSPQAFATVEDTPAILSISASDIDGDELAFEVTGGPSHGQLIGSLPDVGYSPDQDYNGADSFTFVVRDGNGGEVSGTATITISPVNDRPVATAVVTSTPEDTPVSIALAGTDVDGDTLTFTVLTPSPSPLGDLACDAAGACTYSPAANANGADSFVFEVNDGNDFDTADVTITIEPVNDPPTVAALTTVVTDEDTPLAISLHATDIDGDDLEFSAPATTVDGSLSGDAPDLLYTPAPDFNGTDGFAYLVGDGTAVVSGFLSIVVNPVNDAPAATPVSASTTEDTPVDLTLSATDVDDVTSDLGIDPGSPPSGSIGCTPASVGLDCTFTPDANFNGTVQWTYAVTDPAGATSSALITVAVDAENDAPVATGPASVTTAEDTAISVTLTATDDDGDDLIYSIVDQPDNGSLAGTGSALTYTPDTDDNGPDSFEFQVEDGQGGSDTLVVPITVTPVNDAPLALPAVVNVDEDASESFTLLATDVEGDSLTFAVVSGVAHGTLACDGAGACTYAPAADYNGLDSFTFSVTDPAGGSSTATVSITVAAAPLVGTRLVAEPVLLTLGPVFRATLTRVDTGAPLAGRLVVFRAGGTFRCQAVTNGAGLAQCGTPLLDLVALVNLGYDASFAGDFDFAGSAAHGVLLKVTLKLF